MNYGKIAYLKTLDLEQRLGNISKSEDQGFVCSEYSYDTYNVNFTSLHEIDYDELKLSSSGSLCMQSKIRVESTSEEIVTVKVLAGDEEIGSFDQKLLVGGNDIIVYKTYTGQPLSSIDIKIVLVGDSENSKNIVSVNTIFLGILSSAGSSEIELRAIMVNDEILVSYIVGNKLFVATENLSDGVDALEFNLKVEAISHSIINRKINDTQKLQILYVNNENELKICDFNAENSICLDNNVTKVFAKIAPESSDDDIIVCYIKDGQPMYKTISGETVGEARRLPFPSGEYIDIRIVESNDDYVYVVATNASGANFIIKSVMEVSTGKFVESVAVEASVIVYKYLHLPFLTEKTVENISVSGEIVANMYHSFVSLGDKPYLEHIALAGSFAASTYVIEKEEVDSPVVYSVVIDTSNSDPETSVSYADDAASFSAAYMDFDADVFIDNGWTSRWPFNQIKPCLISSSGDVIGYLDPNDYSKFEDGSSADIYTVGSNDVMIEIPRVDYNFENLDDGNIKVSITNIIDKGYCSRAHTYKGEVYDKIYVAAYASMWAASGDTTIPYVPYSLSGTRDRYYYASSASLGAPNMMTYTRTKGYGYEHCPLNVFVMLQSLYLIMFKNLNSQAALGKGVVASTRQVDTGTLDKAGMYYGKNTSSPIKMFGIENIYGNGALFLPGMYVTKTYEVYALNPMSTVDYSFATEETNLQYVCTIPGNVPANFPTKVYATNEVGFVITKCGGSNSTYFCDRMCIRIIQRSYRLCGASADTDVGMFGFISGDNASKTDYVSRMVYYKRSE